MGSTLCLVVLTITFLCEPYILQGTEEQPRVDHHLIPYA